MKNDATRSAAINDS